MEHANESLKAAEAECAEGRSAPRISLGKIEDSIADVSYTTAENAFFRTFDGVSVNPNARIMTLCLVTMRNGFMIIGDSCPMSEANFDFELGKKLAYEKAIRQIWPLMAFAAKEMVYNA